MWKGLEKLEEGVHGTNDLILSIIEHINGLQSILVLRFRSCHSECDSDQEQKHIVASCIGPPKGWCKQDPVLEASQSIYTKTWLPNDLYLEDVRYLPSHHVCSSF